MAQRQNPKEQKTTAKQPRTRAKSITKESEPSFPDHQFRLMIEAVVDYAIYMLDPDGRIMSWNTGAQRLKGYAEAEVIGRHYSMFFTEDAIRAGKPTGAGTGET